MKLREMNLNLLKTLHVLLKVRSVTLASQALYLTQPAVSMALKQLRDIFNDPLLVKGEGALFGLTYKAKQIQPELDKIIAELDALICLGDEALDMSTVEADVRIGSHARINMTVIPKLYHQIRQLAPGIRVTQSDVAYITDQHDTYSPYDVLIGPNFENVKSFTSEKLFDAEVICLSGNAELNKKNKLSLKDLKDNQHVILSYYSDYSLSAVNRALVEKGVDRKHNIVVYDAHIAGQLAKKYGLLLIDIKTKHQEMVKNYGLKQFHLPFDPPISTYHLAWKERDEKNPIISWIREQVVKAVN